MHNAERIGMIVAAGFAIGSGVVAARSGMRQFPAEIMALLRVLLAIPAFAAALIGTRGSLPRKSSVWLMLGVGGLTSVGIPTIAFTLALKSLSSGVLSVMTSTIPLGTALIAHFWLSNERLSSLRIVGLGLALSGTLLLVITGTNGLTGAAHSPDGYVWALGGVASGAFGAVYTRRHLQGVELWPSAMVQMLAALVIVLPLIGLAGRFDVWAVGLDAWLAAGYSALASTFAAFWLYLVIIKKFGATAGALSGYIVPLVATVLGALLLAEVVTGSFVGGAALILAGVFLSSVQPSPPTSIPTVMEK